MVGADGGSLVDLAMYPFRARRLRLHAAQDEDRDWLRSALDQVSRPFGSRVDVSSDSSLRLVTAG
jgi:poly-gamma-glutamate synthesis protein (capsule biosynthesis protein)